MPRSQQQYRSLNLTLRIFIPDTPTIPSVSSFKNIQTPRKAYPSDPLSIKDPPQILVWELQTKGTKVLFYGKCLSIWIISAKKEVLDL